MARMSIDDMLGRDPRLLRLAKACGWSRRETGGCLVLDVWPLCYDREKADIADIDVDIAADMDGFAQLMVNAGLAVRVSPTKVRISGAKKRIKYLQTKQASGYKGGLKSAEARRKESKQNSSTGQANSKHSSSKGQAPVNPSVPDSASASASAPVPPSVPVSDPPPVLVLEEGLAPLAPHTPALRAFDAYFKAANGGAGPTWDPTRVAMLKKLVSKHSGAEVVRRIGNLADAPPPWPSPPWDIATLVQHFDKLAKQHSKPAASQSAFDLQMERVRRLEDEEKEGAA